MKYLRKFETEADVLIPVVPNVVLVEDTDSVLYNVDSSGVYIQHINGALYTTDEWTAGGFTSDLANGVAVIDAACYFVIAKENAYTDSLEWSNIQGSAISGVMITTDNATAMSDYAGAKNTELIAAAGAATSGAAYVCANYTFPNGATGYLPALGEWVVARKYRSAIDTAITLIEGDAIYTNINYWSSTQYSAVMAWTYNWGTNTRRNFNKSSSGYPRAFATLEL